MGIAFQQMDDTLDFAETSQKDQELDLANEQVNFVMYEWLCEDKKRLQSYQSGTKLTELARGADFSAACEKVEKRALDHISKSRKLLEELSPNSQQKEVLVSLGLILDFLSDRAF
jgi:geranylgeranyl pyrophosphate synthase